MDLSTFSASASSFSTSDLCKRLKTTTKRTSPVSLFLRTYLQPHILDLSIQIGIQVERHTYLNESSPPKYGNIDMLKPGNFIVSSVLILLVSKLRFHPQF